MNTLFSQFFLLSASASDIGDKIKELITLIYPVALSIVGGAVVLMAVYIGISFWLAGGEEQKIAKTKKLLINFGIGILIIFVIVALSPIAIAFLQDWVNGTAT